MTIDITSPTPALRQCLRALAVTRYGRLNNDQQCLQHGRRIYSQALGALQSTLQKQPLHDETLASARTLVLYEFLESTSESPSAWETHLSGIARLIEVRGRPQSTLAKAIFEDVRYLLMVKALMRRERSPFCEQEWLSEEMGVQQLWNCGFQFAAILEALERHEDMMGECVSMYRRLEELENQDTDLLHLWAMRLLLLHLMEKLGNGQLDDKEVVAGKMMDALSVDMEVSNFQLGRLLYPINTLLWHFRHSRKEFDEVLTLKQQLSDKGFRLARDLNKGGFPIVKVLQDDHGLTDRSKL
jgi:Fungal specific transcription factor domain